MKKYILSIQILFFINNIGCAQENPPMIETPNIINYSYEVIEANIEIPWAIAFLNENEFLVTEKSGTLYYIKKGQKKEVVGLPKIYNRGQGGLLDVALHPNFNQNNIIYLTLSSNIGEDQNGGNTALYSGVIKEFNVQINEIRLTNLKLLYKGEPNSSKGQHFGSRIVFDDKGYLYFSIGDRGNRDVNPQDIERDGGKIYRLKLDGSIPVDNPFVGVPRAKEAVFSYGHRNPQGMVFNTKTGKVWEHEHGPRGGDEINIIKKGINYGWPKITYGINYSGTSITDKTSAPDMEQPLYYWTPSIAPSGMAFSTSGVYNEWKDNLFVGSLKFEYLERLVIEDNKIVKREKILESIGRVRDVVEGPDGYLYLGVEGKGIIKIIPNE